MKSAENEPLLGDAVENFLQSLQFPVNTTCIGNTIKTYGWPQQGLCEEGFIAGQPHLQNKFCTTCRAGFAVSADFIRCLSPDLKLSNSTRGGFWSFSPELEGASFRIINQHHRCVGPALILFNGPPPARDWPMMPPGIVRPTGEIWLRISYSTLVPFVPRWAIDAPKIATARKQPVGSRQLQRLKEEAGAEGEGKRARSKRTLTDISSVPAASRDTSCRIAAKTSSTSACDCFSRACGCSSAAGGSAPSSNRSSPPREAGATMSNSSSFVAPWLTVASPAPPQVSAPEHGAAGSLASDSRSRESSSISPAGCPRDETFDDGRGMMDEFVLPRNQHLELEPVDAQLVDAQSVDALSERSSLDGQASLDGRAMHLDELHEEMEQVTMQWLDPGLAPCLKCMLCLLPASCSAASCAPRCLQTPTSPLLEHSCVARRLDTHRPSS